MTMMVVVVLCLTPELAKAPESKVVMVSAPVQQSRGIEPRIERRVMEVTAYTANDTGMDGHGITANGEHVQEGRTIAADISTPFGSQIYIPALNHTYTVTDRGGAIKGDRLDIFMKNRKNALKFGVEYLEVWIRE